jgi:acetyltransferase EpsM
MKDLIVYGAGGHGRVVADVAERCGYNVLGYADDGLTQSGLTVPGHAVLGSLDDLSGETDHALLFVAIGRNAARQQAAQRAQTAGWRFATLVHPSAQIGSRVAIGHGTVVMPNCVINADARIGAHAIVNTAATVDHDCDIGDFVHIGPGVHLAGNVSVGQRTQLGVGSNVIPGIAIAEDVMVGAGATVIRQLDGGLTVVGTPARPVRVRI